MEELFGDGLVSALTVESKLPWLALTEK